LGSYGYAGQILQTPAPAEGGKVKKKWFLNFTLSDLENEAKEDKKTLIWDFVFDGAYTEKQENDPSAILSYARYNNNLYIRYFQSVWLEFPEMVKFIEEKVRANGYSKGSRIYLEAAATGMPAAQTLKRYTDLNVIISKTPHNDKMARLNENLAFMEAGRVYLEKNGIWIEDFLKELMIFPNAEHDEAVDLICMAIDKAEMKKSRVLAY